MLGPWVTAATATDIWIVTDQQHPVRALPHVRVIPLDAPTRIEATLSQGLPANPQEAADDVRARLLNRAVTAQLATAYQGVTDAWRVGITTIPAVVVDQRYVVYGDADAAHAVARIHAYREAHP
ncbi:TIGR03757 family integrating conjugative element protein [Burkholderia multivorans]|nr:TIGR03757 family integrating conjugative element protein [Burkholderia multivorans]MDN7689752.1 TIGR03757 family integrating conjugative element protein [Burkholderia multivorans]MDN7708999.1 TIGR03757 family integrating conjugative element protein [Burkholderia multivorans]MDN7714544.1 TIGR03757 family integrating conjugative element protein [Burkholderia multivorans]MDN7773597.1 TIGR03757 family integrating conjugative element protein [Burkholderia multivorans]MDN8093073.1 TIGR03757 famil